MTIGPVAVCVAIFAAIWLFIRYAERAGRRTEARARQAAARIEAGQKARAAPPPAARDTMPGLSAPDGQPWPPPYADGYLAQHSPLIVYPCGCMPCPEHAQTHARRDRAAWEAAMRKEMEQDQ
jgi:hypothetical protein